MGKRVTEKEEGDAYFTRQDVAGWMLSLAKPFLRGIELFVDPSAGKGAFTEEAKFFGANVLSFDINPRHPFVLKRDWLEVEQIPVKPFAVIGNPPFGRSGNLAIKFFNHSAFLGAEVIAFILPKSFMKESCQSKLSLEYTKAFEKELPSGCFILEDGRPFDSPPCVFQVWVNKSRKAEIFCNKNPYFDFVKGGDHDFAIRRVGGRAGQVLENGVELSRASTYFVKAKREDALEVYTTVCMPKAIEISKRTAAAKSVSKNEINKILCEHWVSLGNEDYQ